MTVARATAAEAGRQAVWIARMQPWRGLGYSAAGLGRFLRRAAREGQVLVARARGRGSAGASVMGVVVLQDGVLLGGFVSLLAVREEAAGQGVGRALMTRAAASCFRRRRWLYTSADACNRPALAFYRALGFRRVGRLPDLVQARHTEVLLRLGRAGAT